MRPRPVRHDGVRGAAGRHLQGRSRDREGPGSLAGEHPEADHRDAPAARLRLPQRSRPVGADQDHPPAVAPGLRRPDHLGEDVLRDRRHDGARGRGHGHRARDQLRVHPLRGAHLPEQQPAGGGEQGDGVLHQQPGAEPEVPGPERAGRDGEGEPDGGGEPPDGGDELPVERRRGAEAQGDRPAVCDQQREQRAGGDRQDAGLLEDHQRRVLPDPADHARERPGGALRAQPLVVHQDHHAAVPGSGRRGAQQRGLHRDEAAGGGPGRPRHRLQDARRGRGHVPGAHGRAQAARRLRAGALLRAGPVRRHGRGGRGGGGAPPVRAVRAPVRRGDQGLLRERHHEELRPAGRRDGGRGPGDEGVLLLARRGPAAARLHVQGHDGGARPAQRRLPRRQRGPDVRRRRVARLPADLHRRDAHQRRARVQPARGQRGGARGGGQPAQGRRLRRARGRQARSRLRAGRRAGPARAARRLLRRCSCPACSARPACSAGAAFGFGHLRLEQGRRFVRQHGRRLLRPEQGEGGDAAARHAQHQPECLRPLLLQLRRRPLRRYPRYPRPACCSCAARSARSQRPLLHGLQRARSARSACAAARAAAHAGWI